MAKTVESIGKYKVIAQLARGGMGAVYTARHPTLERTVIIKKLTLRGSADIRERFRREAQIMMDLRNDAIVDVYDHFREGSSYYIVLEYVDGVSLEGLIRERRYLPGSIALLILREVCRGLAYAHARGVVHRDIKPANILISKEGNVKIVDFGIATIHGGDEQSDLTRDGMTLGTPSYMAPEQFQNTRSVDRRADIYSLGVALYEMVTGKRPYPGSFSPEVIARIQRGRYRPPRQINPKVPRFVSRLIRRMINPKPDRRYQDLDRVITRINRRYRIEAHGPARGVIARYLAEENPAALPRRRSPLPIAVGLLVVAALAAGGARIASLGYHRELLQPARWGALEVTARVLAADRDPSSVQVRGQVFVDDGGEIPPLPGGELLFEPIPPSGENVRVLEFASERRQFPPGDYRIKITAAGAVHWESFTLPSLRESRTARLALPGRREDALVLMPEFLDAPELPLEVRITARDRATGRVLQEGLTLSVERDGQWRRLTRLVRLGLRSGTVHRFKIEHPDFRTQFFSLRIAPEQSVLVIDAALEPKE